MTNKHPPPVILCDFDGTITDKNITDFLYQKFASCGSKYSDLWAEGKIGTCEEIVLSFLHISAPKEEMEAALLEFSIDDCFKEFLNFSNDQGYEFAVVSDSLYWAIRSVFALNDIQCEFRIYANQIHFTNDGFAFEFPHFDPEYPFLGVCKPKILTKYKMMGKMVILIGDGKTDMDAARVADIVFARGDLLAYCQDEKIPCYAYQNFCDIIEIIKLNRWK